MVVGAMLLSSSSSGLGIPKSPSFHSSSELAAAAKDFTFPPVSSAAAEPMPSPAINSSSGCSALNVQKQNALNKMKNNNPFLSAVVVGANGDSNAMMMNQSNNLSMNSTSPVSGWGVMSSIRARDRNVYITPAANLAVSLPLLRGLHFISILFLFVYGVFSLHFVVGMCQPNGILMWKSSQKKLLHPHYDYGFSTSLSTSLCR